MPPMGRQMKLGLSNSSAFHLTFSRGMNELSRIRENWRQTILLPLFKSTNIENEKKMSTENNEIDIVRNKLAFCQVFSHVILP